MRARTLRRQAILGAAGIAAALFLACCAAGPVRTTVRPDPTSPSEKPGPWGTTIAVYGFGLYGPELPLSQIVADRHLRLNDGKLRNVMILVNKAQRRLELWVGRHMVKAYRVQLGWHAHGPKMALGDQKTPEGKYFICGHMSSAYYLGLWLAYPNAADARRGLDSGLIGPEQFKTILEKLAAGVCPPQDTKLGGAILLHGQLPELTSEMVRKHKADPSSLRPGWRPGDADPAAMTEFQDWTDGCIALFNPDIRELYEFVADGAEVIIVDNAAVITPKSRR